ncbi:bifunctional DNA primase/polymerase [Marimonas arenosa]|uniref:Bifunctional DNA primase/polymerase n=1 Tax=Marimonas arenosa TaxID=1795305 RepID=A0AAE3WBH7_9RHOB|nr:bifunctional DNA primase/polymerase [Marimonas arenosa]MDQ2088645.1 bifunctional DNA primase/polymerase [Marimonas arenosa]
MAEISRLYEHGFSLIPLGGVDGKNPVVKFGNRNRLPVDMVLEKVRTGKATGYGIRLGGLLVLDIDSTDPAIVRQLEQHFGETPVKTRTPSGGMHLLYRYDGTGAINLKKEGLPVDVKFGRNQYVVGAQSRRPDGATYMPVGVQLEWAALPFIQLDDADVFPSSPSVEPQQLTIPNRVPVGHRHYHLLSVGRNLVTEVGSSDELIQRLKHERDTRCAVPESKSDQEIEKLADWWWQNRCGNRIYTGRNSEFRVSRIALDLLQGNADAEHLYVRLISAHGHTPGKKFAINHAAMKEAGLTDLSRDRFHRARDKLVEVGLLEKAENHVGGKRMRQYRLLRPLPSPNDLPE